MCWVRCVSPDCQPSCLLQTAPKLPQNGSIGLQEWYFCRQSSMPGDPLTASDMPSYLSPSHVMVAGRLFRARCHSLVRGLDVRLRGAHHLAQCRKTQPSALGQGSPLVARPAVAHQHQWCTEVTLSRMQCDTSNLRDHANNVPHRSQILAVAPCSPCAASWGGEILAPCVMPYQQPTTVRPKSFLSSRALQRVRPPHAACMHHPDAQWADDSDPLSMCCRSSMKKPLQQPETPPLPYLAACSFPAYRLQL